MACEPFRIAPFEVEDLAAVRAIYEAAFPVSERKPSDFVAAAASREDYDLLVGRCGAETVAFALVYASGRERVGLLEYMAVAAPWRGSGLASRLFAALSAMQDGRPLLLEVEAEGESPEAARRLAFYKRLGCRRICGPRYRMPQVAANPPPAMHLLLCNYPDPTLAARQLRAWLEAIFADVYGVDAPGRAVREMLEGQPDALKLV